MSPIEQSIKRKIEENGVPLKDWNISINYGIKTGYNDAFIINGEKKDELISADPKSAEIIRPILRGKDIKRYEYSFADLWIINSHNGVKEKSIPPINILEYPAIKAHLDLYYDELSKRYDKGDTPYNLRNCIYTDDFSKQKIVWGNLSLFAQFALVGEEYFLNAPSSMIVNGDEYILAMLNSKAIDWYIKRLGVTRNGGYFEYKPMFVELAPIPTANQDIRRSIIDIVKQIQKFKDTNEVTDNLENSIDQIVYKIFNFSIEEIDYIEEAFNINSISDGEKL